MSDVSFSYRGSQIGSLSATGTLTLKTAGKYCEGDIVCSYVKPSGASILGASVVWNQLMVTPFTAITTSGNKALENGVPITQGHKYLMVVDQSGLSGSPYVAVVCRASGANKQAIRLNVNPSNPQTSTIAESAASGVSTGAVSSTDGTCRYYVSIGSGGGSITNIQLFDLTTMFGADVANDLYALEQASAGKGVEVFKTLFAPNDSYAFTLGTNMQIGLIEVSQ